MTDNTALVRSSLATYVPPVNEIDQQDEESGVSSAAEGWLHLDHSYYTSRLEPLVENAVVYIAGIQFQ